MVELRKDFLVFNQILEKLVPVLVFKVLLILLLLVLVTLCKKKHVQCQKLKLFFDRYQIYTKAIIKRIIIDFLAGLAQ